MNKKSDISPSYTSLASVPRGTSVTITAVDNCPKPLLRKLVAMGIVPGSEVTVAARGAFGSPLNVKLFGSVLSLRKDEAQLVRVGERTPRPEIFSPV